VGESAAVQAVNDEAKRSAALEQAAKEREDALEAGDKPTKSAHFAEVKEQADDEKPFAVDDEKGLDGKTPEL